MTEAEWKEQWDWEHLETLGAGTEEVRSVYRHKPCGAEIEVLQGYAVDICPKCQPEAWDKRIREIGGQKS